MSEFEQKKIRKIERLKNRIAKKSAEAESVLGQARKMQDCIPFGQPILIGHHSEKGDRSFRKRIDAKRSKGHNLFNEVKALEERIEGIERNNAILIDDPNAPEKIKNKIERLRANTERSKAYNKILAKFKTYANALIELQKIIDENSENSATAQNILNCITKQYEYYALPPAGIRAYYFSATNSSAEIRRLEKRLIELENKTSSNFSKKFEHSEVFDDGDYIKIEFSDKPNEEIRKILKSSPLVLKWSSFQSAWVRKKTGQVMTRSFLSSLVDVLKKIQ